MKITTKTNKEQLINTVKANESAVKDKATKSVVKYTLKKYAENPKQVKRTDLVDLVKMLMKSLGKKFVEPALAEEKPKSETSLKKTKDKVKKVLKEDEEAENEPEDEDEEKAEKTAKKSSGKKKTAKKSKKDQKKGVIALEDKTIQMAECFPETIEVGDDTYEIVHDINTMEELHEAFEETNEDGDPVNEFVFAFYWTKRHLRQFPYFDGYLGFPKAFPNDLDLASCIYVADSLKVAYCTSVGTDACYMILPKSLEEIDGIRVSHGIEYQIYRKIDEAE